MYQTRVILCLIGICLLYSTSLRAQQSSLPATSMSAWEAMYNRCGIQYQSLLQDCPNLPDYRQFDRVEDYTQAIHSWFQNNAVEVDNFWNHSLIQACNPSPYYLGIDKSRSFENPMWQWIEASGISDERLAEIAPHMPRPELSGNKQRDEAEYQKQLDQWSILYPLEMEAMVNAPELTALNPYYEGYVAISIVPKFIGAPITDQQPEYIDTGNPAEDELKYQLSLRNWYFVFQPDQFAQKFEQEPRIPEWFDVEKYREETKRNIEQWKQQQASPDLQNSNK